MAYISWDILARLSAEYRLMLRCARTVVGGEDESRIRALCAAALHWPAVVRLAVQYRLVPLVFTTLQRVCPEAVPPTVLSTLREHFQANARRMLSKPAPGTHCALVQAVASGPWRRGGTTCPAAWPSGCHERQQAILPSSLRRS
jgi:hypothetical protein